LKLHRQDAALGGRRRLALLLLASRHSRVVPHTP
jgi:hypothetical protein